VRTLYVGAGLALAGGLLLGTALRPQLDAANPPEDPQAYAGWPAAQTPTPFDDAVTYAGYANQTPDYVVGADALKMLAAADTPPPEDQAYDDAPVREAPLEPQRAVTHEPTTPAEGAAGAEHAAYPAQAPPTAGDAAHDAAAQASAEPAPQALPVQDDEATPEATGDTRIGQ
jgi:hypothetical protein